jgi:nitroimidazol reductase NimA-like FMN-containing flavoprotein (pyridoxamine 5'-phosphate oxidase superfamily)
MTTDRNGLEVLDADECFRLLETATIGRIGITSRALPVILPINYRVDGGQILFRTSAGTKLDAATHNAVVAFEVDGVDPIYHSGWSVLVTGVAQDATARATDDAISATPRWAPGVEDRLVAISIDQISGRRLDAGGTAGWPGRDRA